jgi:hypothetical protein
MPYVAWETTAEGSTKSVDVLPSLAQDLWLLMLPFVPCRHLGRT